jgi:hypothetical protein
VRLGSLERRGFITALPERQHGRAQQTNSIPRVVVLIPWPENDPIASASVSAFAQALNRFG